MKRKYPMMASVIIVLAALVIAGCTDSGDEDEEESTIDFTVEVNYDGTWEGTIDADGSIQDISGNGTKEIDVTAEKISVNVTRTDNGTGSISINIMEGELPLSGTSSMDEYVTIAYPSEEE
jgi:hypothetical protein